MATKTISAGEFFLQAGQTFDSFLIIESGSVHAIFPGGKITLGQGDVIGICDFTSNVHSLTYQAATDCVISTYGSPAQFLNNNYLIDRPEILMQLAGSINHLACELITYYDNILFQCNNAYNYVLNCYADYEELCNKSHEIAKSFDAISTLKPFESQSSLTWHNDYYSGLQNALLNKDTGMFFCNQKILPGLMHHAVKDIDDILSRMQSHSKYMEYATRFLMNTSRNDIFDLYTNLFFKTASRQEFKDAIIGKIRDIAEHLLSIPTVPSTFVQLRMNEFEMMMNNYQTLQEQIESSDESFQNDYSLPGKLADSANVIFEYADCSEELKNSFKQALSAYKNLEDRSATTPEASHLRKQLTELFYQLYIAVFQVSIHDKNIPTIVKMFLNFGYMDAELASMDYACELYNLIGDYRGAPELGIYTIYEWLIAIYQGKKEPCINEFEVDYDKHIRTLKASKKITDEMAAKLLQDRAQKVMFELHNMFPRGCKITNGRLLTFCPILSEHQYVRGPKETILYPSTILKELEEITNLDFSLFYREVNTILSEKENIHDFMHVEIRPDIILMPVVGTRGSMWQEISGRSRATPARMMLPVFLLEDLNKVLLRMCAEFRWEMCKRVQGARWNDVSDPSLTSLFCDYLQFYRKNSDLSPEQKEKIKVTLTKCKQNFKEYFIIDYMTYMLYESKGSPHMTKVARTILFHQCPLNVETRTKLTTHPIYKDILDRYRILCGQKAHRTDNLIKKMEAKRLMIPDILYKEAEYWKK